MSHPDARHPTDGSCVVAGHGARLADVEPCPDPWSVAVASPGLAWVLGRGPRPAGIPDQPEQPIPQSKEAKP